MKKIESLFTWVGLFSVIIVMGVILWQYNKPAPESDNYTYETNKYGAFLVSQYAIYKNDFQTAAEYSAKIPEKDVKIVKNTVILSQFLSGKLPESANEFKGELGVPARFIYDAYLIKNNDWKTIYERHKKDTTSLGAPLRIWSGVATGKITETLKYIDKMQTNDSWKSFVRGQIYAETKDTKKAAASFAKVSTEFMNINDYMYIMAFYTENKMQDSAKKLRNEFTEKPAGMFILDINFTSKWSDYAGFNNELAFNVIQNVSHTQIMAYSDLSLLMLRFAEIIQDNKNNDIINYYIGQYFFNNGGDYKKYFDLINKASPIYPFSMMKIAEKTGDIQALEQAVNANPLFVPAITKLVAKNIQSGDKKNALRIVNKSLENKNLTKSGRVFFLKTRAHIYYVFGDLQMAQGDISNATQASKPDAEILAQQSKIWTLQKQDLDSAYEYAIALVRKNPSNVEYWDILGMAVYAKEGPKPALEIMERVGQVAENCSSLFEHLGDLYVETGNKRLAADAYTRAISLSADGLTVVPNIEKKLRDVK